MNIYYEKKELKNEFRLPYKEAVISPYIFLIDLLNKSPDFRLEVKEFNYKFMNKDRDIIVNTLFNRGIVYKRIEKRWFSTKVFYEINPILQGWTYKQILEKYCLPLLQRDLVAISKVKKEQERQAQWWSSLPEEEKQKIKEESREQEKMRLLREQNSILAKQNNNNNNNNSNDSFLLGLLIGMGGRRY